MIVVGLTGGIGSGKSTVSSLLVERGAVLVDADAITKELQEPGTDVFRAIVERFGDGVVGPDGRLDRAALAAIVFGDPAALKDLNGIVHPAVRAEMARRIAEQAGTDRIVVNDIPLLAESGRKGFAAVIVVDTPVDVAVARLVEHRGFSEADARARIAAQASREERRALADRVVDNGGSREDLRPQVDELWTWLVDLERAQTAQRSAE